MVENTRKLEKSDTKRVDAARSYRDMHLINQKLTNLLHEASIVLGIQDFINILDNDELIVRPYRLTG